MTIDRVGGVLVARLGRRYDAFHETEATDLEKSVTQAIGNALNPRLVLDLAKTDYFSSATIESFFRIWRKMEALGDPIMAIAAPSDFCREIITTARLSDLWPLYPDVATAVEAIRS